MNDTPATEAKRKARLRWVTLGEAIAIAALIISGIGVWLSWKGSSEDKGPTTIVERRQVDSAGASRTRPIGWALAGDHAGRGQSCTPVADRSAARREADRVGQRRRTKRPRPGKCARESAADGKGTHRVRVRIAAKYVEAGADKSATGSYVISYRWEGGGLFGGRSLRLVGLSR